MFSNPASAQLRASDRWARVHQRIDELGEVGSNGDAGRTRLAATDDDKLGRDLLVKWMRDDGLHVQVDQIGNIFGLTHVIEQSPIMIGSHIDSPNNAGKYDGPYGVIAGLEVARHLKTAADAAGRPIAVAAFTNEEGVRFQPDMMGSLVHVGGLALAEALAAKDRDGLPLGSELERIGYAGEMAVGHLRPHRFIEIHIEQGPILEFEGVNIGAVDSLQGISWQEVAITGRANHAGTTPTALRRDAGLAAAEVNCFLRSLVMHNSSTSVATVGRMDLRPNAINVVPASAIFTVDLRDPDEHRLCGLEKNLADFLERLAAEHEVLVATRRLVRFEPVTFDRTIVDVIERSCRTLNLSVKRMASGAGHDAQMMARICPTAMIFVPSRDGVSHNPAEYTSPEQLDAGADVLLEVVAAMLRGEA